MLSENSHKILFVSSPESTPEQIETFRNIDQAHPQKAKERVWLASTDAGIPSFISPGNRIPWEKSWREELDVFSSPYIPIHASRTQRKIDRLARLLGQRLIGLAFGSGAAFGYAVIGMLRILEREGIYPDVISGTSMGALLGIF